jgi:heptosyltransferase-3
LEKVQRILLIQTGDIGDVVLTAPTAPAILETWPGAEVSLLVFKPYGALFQADQNFHEVIEVNRRSFGFWQRVTEFLRLIRRLRARHFDWAIDLRTGDRGAILAGLSGARVRLGRRIDQPHFWRRWLFNRWIDSVESAPLPAHPGADQSLRLLRALGIKTSQSIPRLYISASQQQLAGNRLAQLNLVPGGYFTASLWSRWSYKHWQDERWCELFRQLLELQPYPVLLLGDPGQRQDAMTLAAQMEPGQLIPLAGETSLSELPALIAGSRLHLSVDTAAAHMASALEVPVLTLFGPSDWRAWHLTRELVRVVFSSGFSCLPCNRKGCDDSGVSRCLEQLSVPEVMGVLKEMLNRPGYAERLADFSERMAR